LLSNDFCKYYNNNDGWAYDLSVCERDGIYDEYCLLVYPQLARWRGDFDGGVDYYSNLLVLYNMHADLIALLECESERNAGFVLKKWY